MSKAEIPSACPKCGAAEVCYVSAGGEKVIAAYECGSSPTEQSAVCRELVGLRGENGRLTAENAVMREFWIVEAFKPSGEKCCAECDCRAFDGECLQCMTANTRLDAKIARRKAEKGAQEG